MGKDQPLHVDDRRPEVKAPPQELRANTALHVIETPARNGVSDTAPPRFYRQIAPLWWGATLAAGAGGWWLLFRAFG